MTPNEAADQFFITLLEHNEPSIDAVIEAKRILIEFFEKVAAAAAVAERIQCLDEISRCVLKYEEYERRAMMRDRGVDPEFYATVNARDSMNKAIGAQYCFFVVGNWRRD